MKHLKYFCLLVGSSLGVHLSSFAQQGIGTDKPSKASVLDINSSKKGLLIPRIALQGLDTFEPLTGETDPTKRNSILVYNTATVAGVNGVSPGYYYWSQSTPTNGIWNRLLAQSDAAAVALAGDVTGNTGANTIAPNAVNSAKILNNTILNDDIAPTAAITVDKLAPGIAGNILSTNGTTNAWVAPNTLAINNWYKVGTTSPATSNTDDVFSMGKVGIGTNNPTSKLSVLSNNTTTDHSAIESTLIGANTAHVYAIRSDISNSTGMNSTAFGARLNSANLANQYLLYGYRHDNGNMTSFIKGNGDAFFNGNVGIGTTSPTAKLDIKSDLAGVLSLGSTGSDHVFMNFFARSAKPSERSGWLGYGSAGTNALTFANEINDLGSFNFMTRTADNIKSVVSINNNGNVGIGTNIIPSEKLEVSGNLYLNSGNNTATIYHDLWELNFSGRPGSYAHGNYLFKPGWGAGGNTETTIQLLSANTTGVHTPKVLFSTSGNSYIENGNVGIGTTTPSAKLEINTGTPNTSGLKFTNLTSNSPTTLSTNKSLTVNNNGEVVMGDVNPAASNPTYTPFMALNKNFEFLELTNGDPTNLPKYSGGDVSNWNISYIDVVSGQDPLTRDPIAKELLDYMGIGSGTLHFHNTFRIMKLTRKNNTPTGLYTFFIPNQHAPIGFGLSYMVYTKVVGKTKWAYSQNTSTWGQTVINWSANPNPGAYTHIDYFETTTGDPGDTFYIALPVLTAGIWPQNYKHGVLPSFSGGANYSADQYNELWKTSANQNDIYFNHKVGIGTSTPSEKLEVIDYAKIKELYFGAKPSINTPAIRGNDNLSIGTDHKFPFIIGGAIANTASGIGALTSNTSGNNNSAYGASALLSNTTGFWNTGFGVNTLRLNTTGNYNTAVGVNALHYSTGQNNTAIGANAGLDLTSGDNNIFIGQNTIPNVSSTASNQLNIGNWIFGNNGNIGLGISNPTAKLDVVGKFNFLNPASGSYFQNNVANRDFDFVGNDPNNRVLTVHPGPEAGKNYKNIIVDFYGNDGTNHIDGFTMLRNGNVGIGTTTPTSKLEIDNGYSSNQAINLRTSNAESASYIRFNNDIGLASDIGVGSSNHIWPAIRNKAYFFSGGTNALSLVGYNQPVEFYSNSLTNPNMIIKTDGNVGIGTATPTSKLDVSGIIKAQHNEETGWRDFGQDFSWDGTNAHFYWNKVAQVPSTGNLMIEILLKTDLNYAIAGNFLLSVSRYVGTSYSISLVSLNHMNDAMVEAGIDKDGNVWIRPYVMWSRFSGWKVKQSNITYPTAIFSIPSYQEAEPANLMIAKVSEGKRFNESMLLTHNWNSLFVDGSRVGIGTTNPLYNLHVVGTAGLSTGTTWTNTSDARLKDVIGNYNKGLKEILGLNTVVYRYKKDNPLGLPSDFEKTGFIAQEVQKLIPEAVTTRPDGYLELNVDPIHWAQVNAIQEQYQLWQADSTQKEAAIQQLQKEKAALELKVKTLEAEQQAMKTQQQAMENRLMAIEQKLK